jgi:hypothetical protein
MMISQLAKILIKVLAEYGDKPVTFLDIDSDETTHFINWGCCENEFFIEHGSSK